jgi:regulator of RNase E activity RraA
VSARFGGLTVGRDDVVFADEDGIVFLGRGEAGDVIRAAAGIGSTERAQAARVAEGRSLRDQLSFSDFLREREKDPSYSFRRHLRRLGGAIEE